METLQTIFITLVTLGILVSFHEFGHFWVARRCGVKVLCFSIGFGPSIWQRTGKDGTCYQIAAIPLGGYVKMLGHDDESVAEHEKHLAFSHKSIKQRFAIVAAGPLANFLLAIVVFYCVLVSGTTEVAAVIGEVKADSPAAQAQLQAGDEIVAVDGEPSLSWRQVNMALLQRIGETGRIELSVRQAANDFIQNKSLNVQRWQSDAENPDLLDSLGIVPFAPLIEPVIAKVQAGSAAERAGLQAGDRLIAIDQQALADWQQWVEQIKANPARTLSLSIERDQNIITVILTPDTKTDAEGNSYGLAGVYAVTPQWPDDMLRQVKYGVLDAFPAAVERTWELSVFTLVSIKKMIQGLISPKNLSGPITIAKVAASSAKYGLESYLSFLALLSISLGVLNLLPIPVLDGGHLAFYIIEAIKGSPVSQAVQAGAYQVGMVLVLSLMIFALYNDFTRW